MFDDTHGGKMQLTPQDAHPIVAVLRAVTSTRHLAAVAAVLVEANIRSLEFTFDNHEADACIATARAEFGEYVLIGAGTVTKPDHVRRAKDADADFVVSPYLDMSIGEAAQKADIPWIPGIVTPTEAASAAKHGARALKVFPAGVLGAAWIHQLATVPPYLPMIVTGGVAPEAVSSYLAAGACWVGLGSSLIAFTDGHLDRAETVSRLGRLTKALS